MSFYCPLVHFDRSQSPGHFFQKLITFGGALIFCVQAWSARSTGRFFGVLRGLKVPTQHVQAWFFQVVLKLVPLIVQCPSYPIIFSSESLKTDMLLQTLSVFRDQWEPRQFGFVWLDYCGTLACLGEDCCCAATVPFEDRRGGCSQEVGLRSGPGHRRHQECQTLPTLGDHQKDGGDPAMGGV